MQSSKPGLIETLIESTSNYPSEVCRPIVRRGDIVDSFEKVDRHHWRVWYHRVVKNVPVLPVPTPPASISNN
jgi:hypothetical protein